MKKQLDGNRNLLITILLNTILVVSIVFLMNYVQYLLNEDMRINLTEVVTQNKDVVTAKVQKELTNLEFKAKQLSDRFFAHGPLNEEESLSVFALFAQEQEDSSLVFADRSGSAVGNGGEKRFSVAGRGYFKLGLEGTASISPQVVSRLSGEDVFVLCVPMVHNGEIVGTIQKQYTPQEMYALSAAPLFSEKGSTYIINSQGDILLSSLKDKYARESDNYYRIVYAADATAAKTLENDIRAGRSGFMGTSIDGKRVFFAYTPLEQIHDWFLISSISTSAVSPNGNLVVKLFYIILISTAIIFSYSFWRYGRLKHEQQERLENLAFIDPVTQGISYTKFSLDLKDILKENPQQDFYICSLDVDNFKYINRFYGFETGDRILKMLYTFYSARLLPLESIARITGDRFVLLLTDASPQRLDQLITFDPVFFDVKLYLSAGIYTITDPEESIHLMLDKADTASSANKGMHFKEVTVYAESFDTKLVHDEQTKRAVELALKHNEIFPYFQPKVDIKTRRLVGAEALARWRTPGGELISPGEFIPICEHTGLITLVDMVIFEKTLQFIKNQLDRGVACSPISVNFSRQHLLGTSFLESILLLLNNYQVPPDLIELELTETVIFHNYQTIESFIKELHRHGLKVSMDDFGSGYSSLHMLKNVDIDVLKIDRGFLADSSSDERQRAIFGTIVDLANKLDIKIVVEGVETLENVGLMEEFGCLYAQGFYYARPMDTATFEKIYSEGTLC